MKWEKETCGGRSCRWTRIDIMCSVMCLSAFIITIIVVIAVRPYCPGSSVVFRSDWNAAEAKAAATKLDGPVGVIIIHHTSRDRCESLSDCGEQMRNLQKYHMDANGWDDIGYNFLVGDDGTVYEGRGWETQGAHTRSWNDVSLGIGIMGDYDATEPDDRAVRGLKVIISCGVARGYIKEDYKVFGRMDIKPTNVTSPGKNLYAKIQKWHRYKFEEPVHPSQQTSM